MAAARLLLDEDVRVLLAEVLRQRNYDVVHLLDAGRGGKSDVEQLEYAAGERRAILTHNIRDFASLHQRWQTRGRRHRGVIVSDQLPFRELLRRSLRCLSRVSAEEIENHLIWLRQKPAE